MQTSVFLCKIPHPHTYLGDRRRLPKFSSFPTSSPNSYYLPPSFSRLGALIPVPWPYLPASFLRSASPSLQPSHQAPCSLGIRPSLIFSPISAGSEFHNLTPPLLFTFPRLQTLAVPTGYTAFQLAVTHQPCSWLLHITAQQPPVSNTGNTFISHHHGFSFASINGFPEFCSTRLFHPASCLPRHDMLLGKSHCLGHSLRQSTRDFSKANKHHHTTLDATSRRCPP